MSRASLGVLDVVLILLIIWINTGYQNSKIYKAMQIGVLHRHWWVLKGDIIDKLVEEEFHKRYPENPLKTCIVHNNTMDDDNKKITAYVYSFEASPLLPLA